ncbi:AAA family ATPase [Glycomyces sp. NPDC049804]|uniref:ATP-dependent nuclease n=1 Tax=Glycomyces sp. NPDC049804 TaxID=3154363 RepID=UPI00342EF454
MLEIENFRGIRKGRVTFQQHTLLVGGNNIGKSTVCEALELVLGTERLYRRPVIDEHDFSQGMYLEEDGRAREIRIRVVLTDLSDEQARRVGWGHLRRWKYDTLSYIDEEPGGVNVADDEGVSWAMPVVFVGRYDREEDDFVGETFFDHPTPIIDELDEEEQDSLGAGRAPFTRTHKRMCGLVFLRALRTGSRALSLQRGSLLDTILRLGGDGTSKMWMDALESIRGLDPAIGEIEQLSAIRESIRTRLGKFVNLAPGTESAAFFASDLTREHLREVVRLFLATQPSNHSVPFSRQGTGSINLLVFALLTIIADLRGDQTAIFVMEEPEIALPPHTQRRVTKFVVQQMGQSIVTSHSPYVIEQFEPDNVVILSRNNSVLTGSAIDTKDVKAKAYRAQRRQFAEAILSRSVLVLEGETEMAAVHAVSTALERLRPEYSHIDLAGVSLFNASGDREVPRYGPIFKALGKRVYGMRDELNTVDATGAAENIKSFDCMWESPEKGIEQLLVKQVPARILRSFLETAALRGDYPASYPFESAKVAEEDLADLAAKVLKARKGDNFGSGYTSILIEKCETEDDLPDFIRDALIKIDADLKVEPELSLNEEAAAEPADVADIQE